MEDIPDPVTYTSYSAAGSSDMDEMFGPTQADDAVRQALAAVWRSLPRSKRDPDTIEKHLLRLTKRALANFREDELAFEDEND